MVDFKYLNTFAEIFHVNKFIVLKIFHVFKVTHESYFNLEHFPIYGITIQYMCGNYQFVCTSIGLKLGRRVAMVNAAPSNNADTYWGSVSCDVMGGAIMRT